MDTEPSGLRVTPAESGLRRPPSMMARFIWVFFWFIMWSWAIMAPINVVLCLVDILFEPGWINIGGPNRAEKIRYMQFAIGVSVLGGCFAWLRLSGDLKFSDEIVFEPHTQADSSWPKDAERLGEDEFRSGPPPRST